MFLTQLENLLALNSVKLKFSSATKSKETLRIAIRMERATEIFV